MSCTISSTPHHKIEVNLFPEEGGRSAFVALCFNAGLEMWPANFTVILDSPAQAQELLDALGDALAPRPETE